MDKKEAINKVKEYGMDLEQLPEKFKKDKDVVLEAVLNAGEAIQFADPKLKLDKKITLAAVKTSAYALEHVDDKFRGMIGGDGRFADDYQVIDSRDDKYKDYNKKSYGGGK